jgi:hypothetical protein
LHFDSCGYIRNDLPLLFIHIPEYIVRMSSQNSIMTIVTIVILFCSRFSLRLDYTHIWPDRVYLSSQRIMTRRPSYNLGDSLMILQLLFFFYLDVISNARYGAYISLHNPLLYSSRHNFEHRNSIIHTEKKNRVIKSLMFLWPHREGGTVPKEMS